MSRVTYWCHYCRKEFPKSHFDDDWLCCIAVARSKFKPEPSSFSVVSETPHDGVNHPPHYTHGSIECIRAIQAALTPAEFRGFCKGNVIKYTWRELSKGGDESLAKAIWYLQEALSKEGNDS